MTKPNIVIVMTDDQSVDTLATCAKLQSLMGDHGVRFDNSFVDLALCSPSRASFLTGLAAHNTGMYGNSLATHGAYPVFAPFQSSTLPMWLQAAGYQTGIFGKYMNKYAAAAPYKPPGWDNFLAILDPIDYYNYRFVGLNGNIGQKGSAPTDYLTDYLTGKALDWIRTWDSSPHFLLLTPFAPHRHYTPAPRHSGHFSTLPPYRPPNFNEADISDKPAFRRPPLLTAAEITQIDADHRLRANCMLAVEDMMESLIDQVVANGQIDNTYFIFTSDNGFSQGQHRRAFNKKLVYDEIGRVPLFIRGPGIPEGEVRTQLVNNLDLPATICDWADATPGRVLDGATLAPLLADNAAPWRTALLAEGSIGDGLDETLSLPLNRFSAIRTSRYIYAENYTTTGMVPEFYDHGIDPYELENCPNDPAYAGVIAKLAAILAPLRTASGAGCWVDAAV